MNPFTPFNRVKECRYGNMLYNINDFYIGGSLERYGEFSEGETQLFRQVVQPGMVAVEVGSNIGTHTVFLAQAVFPTGQVWAFEPQRIVFQALCANLALNSIPNVMAQNLAVGAAPGELLVPFLDYTQQNNFGGVELGRHQQGERVPIVTLDSMNLARCDFLKIDVEGMEKPVLEGAVKLLERCQPLLYVENDRKDKSAALIRFVDSLGYKMHWHIPPLFNPNNFAKNPVNIFGNVASFNMFCVPPSRNVKVEGFPPVEVPAAEST